MITTAELDDLLYQIASMIALSAYLSYNCYFMGREAVFTTMQTIEDIELAEKIGGVSVVH